MEWWGEVTKLDIFFLIFAAVAAGFILGHHLGKKDAKLKHEMKKMDTEFLKQLKLMKGSKDEPSDSINMARIKKVKKKQD